MILLLLIFLISTVLAAIIPRSAVSSTAIGFKDYPEEAGLYNSVYDSNTDGILLPHDILSQNELQKLGIPGSIFNLLGGSETPAESFFLPFNTRGLFLFNMNEPVTVGENSLNLMMPFDLDGNYRLRDYQLLLPKPFLDKYGISGSEEGRKLSSTSLLYRHPVQQPLDFDIPLLILFFEQDLSATKGTSKLFFDIFTKTWILSQDPLNLMHSIFCSINSESATSACLRIHESNKQIGIFPAFAQGSKTQLNYNTFFRPILKLAKREIKDSEGALQFKDFRIQVDDSKPLANDRYCANTTDCLDEQEYSVESIPDSLWHQIDPPPRNPQYSQVIFPDLVHITLNKRSVDEENSCSPVTWANLFQHALFGRPRFCNI